MIRHNNSIFNIGSSIPCLFDLDASKVIEAVRSTGVTITLPMRHYAHYLCSNTKNIGTWQNSNAVYGFVGGTAASHKFNWKNPIDTDGAFRLTPVGAGTFTNNANGMKGASASAMNTFVNRNTLVNGDTHFSNYTTVDDPTGDAAMGVINVALAFNLIQRVNGLRNVQLPGSTLNVGNIYPALSVTKGYHIATISSNSLSYFYKGVPQIASSANNVTLENFSGNIYVVGRNDLSSTTLGSLKTYGYFSIGSGFTDTQSIQQSQIVKNAQTILNRA
jgi:hypothetical protein